MVEKTDDELDSVGRGHFDLLMNAGGELMVAFRATEGDAENPLFIYDGRGRAILYKNKTAEGLPFAPLPKEAQEALNKSGEILCVEVADEHIVSQYSAKIEVKK